MNTIFSVLASAGSYLYILLIIGVLIAFAIGYIFSYLLSPIASAVHDINLRTVNADPIDKVANLVIPVGGFLLIAGFGLLLSVGITLGLASIITTFAPAKDIPAAPPLEMLVTPDSDGATRTLRFTYQPRAVITSDASLTVEVTDTKLDATQLVIWSAASNDMTIRTDEECPETTRKSEDHISYSCAKPRDNTVALHWFASPKTPGSRFVTVSPDPATPWPGQVSLQNIADSAVHDWLYGGSKPSFDRKTSKITLPFLALTASTLSVVHQQWAIAIGSVLTVLAAVIGAIVAIRKKA